MDAVDQRLGNSFANRTACMVPDVLVLAEISGADRARDRHLR